ncbi:monofunctional biosynthetic peptidoglycan transglycosylase [Paracoccus laeviglucosivorans]|uniref:Biosynthetic peptidoglycan transglycosylase n=1 Tax=Paracoccus laeviglucosivorans TaxID=1197861 RepID=A0A521FP06_9RHOB|nr:monofunctional biosynthetic peptidoglycan transglycosylase [Paracoccus laeviglucosivorans]SMO97856.1 monofunctional biosynthetic peptidoglycan transglycosylase [Paracoccus laeviglucosivorans]
MPRRSSIPEPEALVEDAPRPAAATRWRPMRRMAIWLWGWSRWLGLRLIALMLVLVFLFSFINPPTSWTIITGQREFPGTPHEWVDLDEVSPHMARAVVAAEDANFCNHWGFDMIEIRRVIASGSSRGASTISQQTAKNVFLWQGRSWPRKVLETAYTPMIELLWSKRRIVEVYLNLAEFGRGVFGIHAAAQYYYKTTPDKLTLRQAAALASILPAPRTRNPQTGSARTRQIVSGAQTIQADGRDSCLLLTR